ncbi:MAG: copper resistance D family protein [Actinomycetota bacterium]
MGFEDSLREVAFAFVRFFSFTAHAALFGIPVICLLVLRPVFASLVDDEIWSGGRGRLGLRLEGAVRAAMIGSVVATVVGIVLQAILVATLNEVEVSSSSFGSVFRTSFGQWYVFRFPLLAGLYVLLGGQIARWALARGGAGRMWWIGWIVLAAGLLSTSTFTGHAAVASPRWAGLVNDFVHLAAGSIWFAGIVMLAVFLPDAWRGRTEPERLALLAPVVIRFSQVALISIAIVAATGVLNSLFNVAHFGDLFGAAYGLTLTFKLLLFAGVLAMGAVNHFVLRDRMARAVRGGPATVAHVTFRRTIAIELTIAVAIMGATGWLTGQAKTRQAGSEAPVVETEVSGGSTP